MIRKTVVVAAALALAMPAFGADRIKIGFLTTLTGPAAFLGRDMVNGALLALEEQGGRMGGDTRRSWWSRTTSSIRRAPCRRCTS